LVQSESVFAEEALLGILHTVLAVGTAADALTADFGEAGLADEAVIVDAIGHLVVFLGADHTVVHGTRRTDHYWSARLGRVVGFSVVAVFAGETGMGLVAGGAVGDATGLDLAGLEIETEAVRHLVTVFKAGTRTGGTVFGATIAIFG
jgi:hypothetical protein